MSRRTTALALSGVLALSLSACGDDDGMPVKGSSEAFTLAPGESVDLDEIMSYPDIELTLDGIERDASCPGEEREPDGEWVALDLTLERTGDADRIIINSDQWTAVADDGSQTELVAMMGTVCLPAEEQLPAQWPGDEDEISRRLHLMVPEGTVQVQHHVTHDTRSGRLVVDLG